MTQSREQEKQGIIQGLQANTGRTLAEWADIVETEGPEDTEERVEWLQEIHSLDFLQAVTIVEETEQPSETLPHTDQDRLDALFVGDKAKLRPIYERLRAVVSRLDQASVAPHYTYVALLRDEREFGIIYVGETHIDLGLNLPNVEPTDRLEPAELFGDIRITHRVTLQTPLEIDHDVIEWIKAAYEANE